MAMRRRVGGGSGQSTAVNTAVAAGNSEGGAVATDPDDLKRDLYKYEDDMGDSKGPRLTLMEEVLLLGLKDREVRHHGCSGVDIHTYRHSHKYASTLTHMHKATPFLPCLSLHLPLLPISLPLSSLLSPPLSLPPSFLSPLLTSHPLSSLPSPLSSPPLPLPPLVHRGTLLFGMTVSPLV